VFFFLFLERPSLVPGTLATGKMLSLLWRVGVDCGIWLNRFGMENMVRLWRSVQLKSDTAAGM